MPGARTATSAYALIISTGCSLLFHGALLLLLCSFSPTAPTPEPRPLLVTLSSPPQLTIESDRPAMREVPEPLLVLKPTLPPLLDAVEPPPPLRDEAAEEDGAPAALEDVYANGTAGMAQVAAAPAADTARADAASFLTAAEDWSALPGRRREAGPDGGGDGGLVGAGGGTSAGQGGGSGGGDGTGQGSGRGSGPRHGGPGIGVGGGMPGAVQVAHPSGAGSGGRRAAKVVERKPGEYPDAARRAGLEGVVLLLVEVLHDGKVGQVAVQESSGVAELDAAARRAVRNWRFEPARESDQPVVSWAVVKYRYTFADR